MQINIAELHPGVRVRIVDEFTPECFPVPPMKRWLGQDVTVKTLDIFSLHPYARIEEDNGRWKWFLPSIACIVQNDEDEFEAPDWNQISVLSLF